MKYNAVLEWAGEDFNGYLIELPGVVAAGDTKEEALANLAEGAHAYIEELRYAGQPVPRPQIDVREIEVEVA